MFILEVKYRSRWRLSPINEFKTRVEAENRVKELKEKGIISRIVEF